MGGPKGVIRPGINLAVRVARDARDGDAASPERSELSKKKRITPADAPRVGGGESASARDGGSADLDPDPEASLAKKKKGKNKKDRQKRMMAHLSLRAEVTTPVASRDHPFEVDAADHCETPFQAYQDIEPFLFRIALALKKPKEKLRIYDPYFCEGSVVAHLARLGFTSVHNVNEDFYRNVEEGNILNTTSSSPTPVQRRPLPSHLVLLRRVHQTVALTPPELRVSQDLLPRGCRPARQPSLPHPGPPQAVPVLGPRSEGPRSETKPRVPPRSRPSGTWR